MPNVIITSKLSQTKVYRCVIQLVARESVQSSINLLFNCVYAIIFWFDYNRNIIENRDVLIKIIMMLNFTQSLRPNSYSSWVKEISKISWNNISEITQSIRNKWEISENKNGKYFA